MRHAPFVELPDPIRNALLESFPALRDHVDTAEVLWLSGSDFPRLRLEDVASECVRVIVSSRPWRFSHGREEQAIQPFEPVLVMRRVPVPRVAAAPRRRARPRVRVALSLLVAGLIGLGLGMLTPRSWSTLEAAQLVHELWQDEPGLIRMLEQTPADAAAELANLAVHHPSERVRALAERLRQRTRGR